MQLAVATTANSPKAQTTSLFRKLVIHVGKERENINRLSTQFLKPFSCSADVFIFKNRKCFWSIFVAKVMRDYCCVG